MLVITGWREKDRQGEVHLPLLLSLTPSSFQRYCAEETAHLL